MSVKVDESVLKAVGKFDKYWAKVDKTITSNSLQPGVYTNSKITGAELMASKNGFPMVKFTATLPNGKLSSSYHVLQGKTPENTTVMIQMFVPIMNYFGVDAEEMTFSAALKATLKKAMGKTVTVVVKEAPKGSQYPTETKFEFEKDDNEPEDDDDNSWDMDPTEFGNEREEIAEESDDDDFE